MILRDGHIYQRNRIYSPEIDIKKYTLLISFTKLPSSWIEKDSLQQILLEQLAKKMKHYKLYTLYKNNMCQY